MHDCHLGNRHGGLIRRGVEITWGYFGFLPCERRLLVGVAGLTTWVGGVG